MGELLEAVQVTKVFDSGGSLFRREKTVALQNFSLSISAARPSIIAIAGESGSGKTTLARLLLGIIRPTSGHIVYQGKNLEHMSQDERRTFRREVQAIFQDPFEVYNPFYKVDHVLTTPVAKFKLAGSRAEARELIEDALRGVGLRPEETLGRYPHQLSGGQRQRIMVARALALRPRIILADEPVSMVDASLRATILESLLKLNQELGISLIYITHDLTTAYQLCEQIVILYQGCVAEVGDIELVIKNPRHPYTQLLVGSIPLPNPELRWGRRDEDSSRAGAAAPVGNRGCKFADRCPQVMDICYAAPPPLFHTEEGRAAACYLYQGAATVKATGIMDKFDPPDRPARQAISNS
jgi:oligopeptide/dipeptide ABC transporter ATP-binding protein